jgi:hypothetical protein
VVLFRFFGVVVLEVIKDVVINVVSGFIRSFSGFFGPLAGLIIIIIIVRFKFSVPVVDKRLRGCREWLISCR